MTPDKKWRTWWVRLPSLIINDLNDEQQKRWEHDAVKVTEHAAVEELEREVDRLNRIIAKELSENDELGAEYTYINVLKTKLADAREEVERLKEEITNSNKFAQDQEDKIESLTQKLARAVEALEFYAKERLYVNIGVASDLYDDRGKKAREALEEIK